MKKRLVSILLLLAILCPMALAESASTPGEFIRAAGEELYLALSDGNKNVLYSVPRDGNAMTVLESGDSISDIVYTNDGNLYYLRLEGANFQIVHRVQGEDDSTVIAEFGENDVVSGLHLYEGMLYSVVNNHLTSISPATGDLATIGANVLMREFVIVEDVVFFVSGDNTKTYERLVTTTDETLKETAGTLWSMDILGENPELLLDEGVSDLKAYGSNLYFHNLADSYPMGNTDEMWLEGKLYRYDINAGESSSMGLEYDWDFFPTQFGVVVYTSMNISLYPANGGAGTTMMEPELRTGLTAYDGDAYVYEYTDRRLTILPLNGTEPLVVYDNGTLTNPTGDAVDPYDIADDGEPQDADVDGQTTDDQPEPTSSPDALKAMQDDPDAYIFPNSSTEKLTKEDILAVDKSLWGYGRNEIYARHGYPFGGGKYGQYFATKSWYTSGGFSKAKISSVEWYNMELIRSMEREYGMESSSTNTIKKSSSPKSSSKAKNNYYIFPNSSKKKLTKKQILSIKRSLWGYARNEIYARHGYSFKTAKYRKYFRNQKWYKEGGFSRSKLNSIEWYNMELIKEMEAKY
ncbi:MAG: YARHG domain-containing protein [Christensenellales bacterium]|jgi:hypothetical protein